VVLAQKPLLDDQADQLEPALRDELLTHMGTLASVYHRPPHTFVAKLKGRAARPQAKVCAAPPCCAAVLHCALTPLA
jgi:hypothetical protein